MDTDVVIVGAGPVGLYAAYYAGFRELSTVVVDSLTEPGGQITALYPEKLIHDVAGLPGIKGRRLVDQLVEQADQFGPTMLMGQTAEKLEHLLNGRLRVTTSLGRVIEAGAVIIAGGIGTFEPRPLLPGDRMDLDGLQYFVPDTAAMAGLNVVIAGGGDSAVDWANELSQVARSVRVVHRRDAFRAHESNVTRMRSSGCDVLTPYVVSALRGEQRVRSVEVRHVGTGELLNFPCDVMVAALGFTASLGPLEEWGLELRDRHILADAQMRTCIPGVFAVGDIADHDGKVRLLSVGFGEAATAVNHAAARLRPGSTLAPGHSTDMPEVRS